MLIVIFYVLLFQDIFRVCCSVQLKQLFIDHISIGKLTFINQILLKMTVRKLITIIKAPNPNHFFIFLTKFVLTGCPLSP